MAVTSGARRQSYYVPAAQLATTFRDAMKLLPRILPMLVTAILALPALAAAKAPGVIAPPGDSAISQYVEVVPNDMGVSPPAAGTAAKGIVHTAALTPRQQRRLDRLGRNGRALAVIVAATAQPAGGDPGPRTAAARSETSHAAAASHVRLSAAGAPSALSLLLHGAAGGGGSGGVGLLLPAIMLGAALGVVATVVLRRRTSL
jgi:hypothetical protein